MPDAGRIAGPVVVPNCIQVRLIWTLATAKTVHNVLHGRVVSGFAPSAAIAEAVRAAIAGSGAWTTYKAFLNSAVGFAGVDLRDLRAANFPLVESTGAIVNGTGAGSALPPEVALVATLRTASAGRAFRGRSYLPGFDSTALVATGYASAGAIAAAQAFMAEVQTAMGANGLTMCIAQPARAAYTGVTGATHAARSAATADVTSIAVRDGIFDSQRRRSQ